VPPVGCTRVDAPPSTSQLKDKSPITTDVEFGLGKPAPIPRVDYVVRAREVGRPLSPDSIRDDKYVAPEFASIEQLRGPHTKLAIDLNVNEIAPLEDQGAAYFDPQSQQVTWPAYTCMNAKCKGQGKDGRPYLFVRKLPDVSVAADGRIELGPKASQKLLSAPTCPACNSNGWTGAYEPPEVAERRALLEAELAESRAARQKAKRIGTAMPTDHRTPVVIMQDLSTLPKLYLLPSE
jgi:hypothetical protein